MLTKTEQIFPIDPLVEQVNSLSFDKRLNLNKPTGKFFSDSWETLDEFKGTPLGKVLENIPKLGEARLLKLTSGETYTAHADPDDRFHVPITTNDQAYLIDLDNHEMFHLPADGRLWRMDTSVVHVAANFGGRDRIHLNTRVLVPGYKSNLMGLKITFEGGDFDWKQESYIEIMPFLNRAIKTDKIKGFEKLDEKSILVNPESPYLFDNIKNKLERKGFRVSILSV